MSFAGQVLHVFRKDVRRYWPALAGVGVLMGVHVFVGLDLPNAYRFALPQDIAIFSLLFGAITVLVVQSDSVVNDRAFWATRPLGPMSVLTAKALFIGVFLCAGPVAAQILWIEAVTELDSMASAVAHATLHQAAVLAIVALGAAVTPHIRAFLALGLAAWIASNVIAASSGASMAPFWHDGVGTTRVFLIRCIWLLVGVVMVLHQYRTRHARRTIALAALSFGVLLPLAHRSDLDLSSPSPYAPAERHAYPDADSITFSPRSLQWYTAGRVGDGSMVMLFADLRAEPGPAVLVGAATVESRISGGGVDRMFEVDPLRRPFVYLSPPGRPNVPGLRPAGPEPSYPSRPAVTGIPLLSGAFDLVDELDDADRIEAQVRFDVFAPGIAQRVPPVVGARGRIGERSSFTVLEVDRASRSARYVIELTEVRPALESRGDPYRPAALLLANRERGEYIRLSGGGGTDHEPHRISTSPLVGGVVVTNMAIGWSFTAQMAERQGDGYRLPDDWFDDVELIILEPEYVGSFTRQVTLDVDTWPPVDGRPVELEGPG